MARPRGDLRVAVAAVEDLAPEIPPVPIDDRDFAFTFAGELAKTLPPKAYLVRHFGIAPGRVTLITGYGGVGKTVLAQALALAVACDSINEWCGLDLARHGKVRHIDFEMGEEDLSRRYQRLAVGLSIDLASLGDRLGVVSMPNVKLADEDAEERFARACVGVTLAIVDNLAAATPGVDENSTYMRTLLDKLSRVSIKTGCVFVILHHENKPGRDRQGPSTVRSRGSSAITDAAGNVLSIYLSKGAVGVAHTKPSAGSKGSPIEIEIEDVGEKKFGYDYPGLAVRAVANANDEADQDLDDGDADPTADAGLCEALVDALRKAGKPVSQSTLFELVPGRKETKREQVDALVAKGVVAFSRGARGAKIYCLSEASQADA